MRITDIYLKKWTASFANVLVYLNYGEYTFALVCLCVRSCLSPCVHLCVPVCNSVCICVCVSVWVLCVRPCVHLCECPWVRPCVCPCVRLCMHPRVTSVCANMYLRVSLCVPQCTSVRVFVRVTVCTCALVQELSPKKRNSACVSVCDY